MNLFRPANADSMLAIATGKTTEHLVDAWGGVRVHRDVVGPLLQLRDEAHAAGFELAVASSYRDFDRQAAIWREKVSGERPLLSVSGEPVDGNALSDVEKLKAIMRWSAIPGASRHHWGTDLDVFDGAALKDGTQLQLVPEEYCEGGPFAEFSRWLDRRIDSNSSFGFFRPYRQDRGAIAPEPWHISYRPVAEQVLDCFDLPAFQLHLESLQLPLVELLRADSESIYHRFVALKD